MTYSFNGYTLLFIVFAICITSFFSTKSLREDFVICDSECNLSLLKQRFERERNTFLQQLIHLRTLISNILGKDFKYEKPLKNIQGLSEFASKKLISDVDVNHFCKDVEQTWNGDLDHEYDSRTDIVNAIIDNHTQYNEHLSIIYIKRKESLKRINSFIDSIRTLKSNLSVFCDNDNHDDCKIEFHENIFETSEKIQQSLSSEYKLLLTSICILVNYSRGLNELAKQSKKLAISMSKL